MRIDLLLFILSVLLFTLFPQIDLWSTGQFYDSGFYLQSNLFFTLVYELFAYLHLAILPLLIVLALYSYVRYRNTELSFKKNIYTFLTLSLILGPGILVNTILKNNSLGRARPSQISEFGGSGDFTRAFEYSGQCETNCSFVSGHASMGFWFIGLGWLLQSKKAFYVGLAIGSVVGLTRIVQGGHFLSDTIFALWAVYGINLLLGKLLKIRSPLDPVK